MKTVMRLECDKCKCTFENTTVDGRSLRDGDKCWCGGTVHLDGYTFQFGMEDADENGIIAPARLYHYGDGQRFYYIDTATGQAQHFEYRNGDMVPVVGADPAFWPWAVGMAVAGLAIYLAAAKAMGWI